MVFLKFLQKFTGKHLSWSLFLIKETPTLVFSSQICQKFLEYLLYRTSSMVASICSFQDSNLSETFLIPKDYSHIISGKNPTPWSKTHN